MLHFNMDVKNISWFFFFEEMLEIFVKKYCSMVAWYWLKIFLQTPVKISGFLLFATTTFEPTQYSSKHNSQTYITAPYAVNYETLLFD